MKRQIYLAGAATAASSLVLAVAFVPAAISKPKRAPGLTCHVSIGVSVPVGSTQVVVPADQGSMYGSVRCKQFGAGLQSATFSVVNSGDTVGRYVDYFDTGTIRGAFDLTPQEGTFGGNPASASYLGTLTIKGGTGAYVGIKGKGTSTCASADGVHMTCTLKLKLK